MTTILSIALPVYFLLYFGIAFVAKTLFVARKTGKNPLVLPTDDTAYGLIGLYFKYCLLSIFIYVSVNALWPASAPYFMPVYALDHISFTIVGIVLLVISFAFTIIAQVHMKDSWRIGIDKDNKTSLITTGLFAYSRNPVFLAMLTSLFGLFLVRPNAFTALVGIVSYILIQVQIRLEEEYLSEQHGSDYEAYKKTVRRFF